MVNVLQKVVKEIKIGIFSKIYAQNCEKLEVGKKNSLYTGDKNSECLLIHRIYLIYYRTF